MKESNYIMFVIVRLFMALIPLALGWPLLALCYCAYNLVMITIQRGPLFGSIAIALTSMVGAGLCYAFGLGAAYGGFFALELMLASALCTVAVVTRRSFATGLLLTSVGYGLGSVMNLKYMAENAGLSIADYMFHKTGDLIDRAIISMGDSYQLAGQTYSAAEIAYTVTNVLRSMVPAAVIVSAMTAGYVIMWLVTRNLRGTPLNNGHSFAGIRLSLPAVGFGAVMLVLLFLGSDTAATVGINGLLIFISLAFFAGLSLVEFLLRLKMQSMIGRAAIHVLIFVGGYVVMAFMPLFNIFLLYALLGLVDCFASIRKRVTAKL